MKEEYDEEGDEFYVHLSWGSNPKWSWSWETCTYEPQWEQEVKQEEDDEAEKANDWEEHTWYSTTGWDTSDLNQSSWDVKDEAVEVQDETNDDWTFSGDLGINVQPDEYENAEQGQPSGSTPAAVPAAALNHQPRDEDPAMAATKEELEEDLPEPGVEPNENLGPDYNPNDYMVTKTGWQNYCILMVACHQKKRFTLLERIVKKLAQKDSIKFKVKNLESHIQKWGDTGPRRMGFDFD